MPRLVYLWKKTPLPNQSLTQNFNHSRPTRPPSEDSGAVSDSELTLFCDPQLPLAWIWCFLNWDTPMAKDTWYVVGKYNWYIKLMISRRLLLRMRLQLMCWWYSSLHYRGFKYRIQEDLWIFYTANLILESKFTHCCIHGKSMNTLDMYDSWRENFYKFLKTVDLINVKPLNCKKKEKVLFNFLKRRSSSAFTQQCSHSSICFARNFKSLLYVIFNLPNCMHDLCWC